MSNLPDTFERLAWKFLSYIAKGIVIVLIEQMFETISNEKEEVLEMLISTQVVIPREDECKMLTISSIDTYDPLSSTQEEADRKVIAHATEFLDQDSSNKVNVKLTSGDTDIIVHCVTLLRKDPVIIDNGSGKARTPIHLVRKFRAVVKQVCISSVETITFPPF